MSSALPLNPPPSVAKDFTLSSIRVKATISIRITTVSTTAARRTTIENSGTDLDISAETFRSAIPHDSDERKNRAMSHAEFQRGTARMSASSKPVYTITARLNSARIPIDSLSASTLAGIAPSQRSMAAKQNPRHKANTHAPNVIQEGLELKNKASKNEGCPRSASRQHDPRIMNIVDKPNPPTKNRDHLRPTALLKRSRSTRTRSVRSDSSAITEHTNAQPAPLPPRNR